MRVVVTALAVGLLAESWKYLHAQGGPAEAFVFIYAALAGVGALVAIAWAWKRHPF